MRIFASVVFGLCLIESIEYCSALKAMEQPPTQSWLALIPDEIKIKIAELLANTYPKKAAFNIIALSKTCKRWRTFINNENTLLLLLEMIPKQSCALDILRTLSKKPYFLSVTQDASLQNWATYTKSNLVYGKDLYHAIQRRHIEMVIVLLGYKNLNTNWRNKSQDTPLMWATCNTGCKTILSLLLTAFPDVDLQDSMGSTALMWAADAQGEQSNISELLAAGADPDISDKLGNTALIRAATHGKEEVVALLIAAGASVDKKNKQGETALMATTNAGSSKKIALLLLAAGANREITNNHGFTAYQKARQKKLHELADLMRSSEQQKRKTCSIS